MNQEILQRLSTLPDSYRLTVHDAPLVGAVAHGTSWSYANQDDDLLDGFLIFERRVYTAGDLRNAMRDNPPPPEEEREHPDFADLLLHAFDEITLNRIRIGVLRDLLLKKQLFTEADWVQEYNRAISRDFWAFRDQFQLRPEAYTSRWAEWLKEREESGKAYAGIAPIPDYPWPIPTDESNHKSD